MLKAFLKAFFSGIVTGFVFLVAFPFLVIQVNSYFGLLQIDYVVLDIVGVFLVFCGILMFLYCSGIFWKLGKGTPAPIEPPRKIVTEGIYRYTRNPMYLGYFSIVTGQAFFFGDILLFAYLLFVILLINVYLLFFEEPALKKRFGKEYEDYVSQTPRWIFI